MARSADIYLHNFGMFIGWGGLIAVPVLGLLRNIGALARQPVPFRIGGALHVVFFVCAVACLGSLTAGAVTRFWILPVVTRLQAAHDRSLQPAEVRTRRPEHWRAPAAGAPWRATGRGVAAFTVAMYAGLLAVGGLWWVRWHEPETRVVTGTGVAAGGRELGSVMTREVPTDFSGLRSVRGQISVGFVQGASCPATAVLTVTMTVRGTVTGTWTVPPAAFSVQVPLTRVARGDKVEVAAAVANGTDSLGCIPLSDYTLTEDRLPFR